MTSEHPVLRRLHFVPLHSTTPPYGTSDGKGCQAWNYL